MEYNEARDLCMLKKKERQNAKAEIDSMEKKTAPLAERIKELEQKIRLRRIDYNSAKKKLTGSFEVEREIKENVIALFNRRLPNLMV